MQTFWICLFEQRSEICALEGASSDCLLHALITLISKNITLQSSSSLLSGYSVSEEQWAAYIKKPIAGAGNCYIQKAGLKSSDIVLEIGPGTGTSMYYLFRLSLSLSHSHSVENITLMNSVERSTGDRVSPYANNFQVCVPLSHTVMFKDVKQVCITSTLNNQLCSSSVLLGMHTN